MGELPPVPTTLDGLVRFAGSNDGPVDLIVVGRVVAVEREGEESLLRPDQVPAGAPVPVFPYTDLRVEVEQVLAGTSGVEQLRLREPGHQSDGGLARKPMPVVGRRMILLLNQHPNGEYYTAHPYAEIDLTGRVPVFNDGKRTPVSDIGAPTVPAELARAIAAIAKQVRP